MDCGFVVHSCETSLPFYCLSICNERQKIYGSYTLLETLNFVFEPFCKLGCFGNCLGHQELK